MRNKGILGKANKKIFPFFIIAFFIVLFNLIGVFGIHALLTDDLANYDSYTKGEFPKWKFKYHLISPYRHWIQWIIIDYSVYLMRGIFVLFFMIPISWCFYYLYSNILQIPRLPALTASVLPHILPSQWLIPACINFSSPLWGFLFSTLALMAGLKYLSKSNKRDWTWLLGAVLLYLISLNSMEQSLFLLPPLIFAFIAFTKLNKKHFWLISSFFLLAVVKFLRMVLIPRKKIHHIPLDEIWERIGHYFKWSFPSPDISPLILVVLYLGIIILGFILFLRRFNTHTLVRSEYYSHLKQKTFYLYIYAFFLLWSVSTIFVFIFVNEKFVERYTYISSFGFIGLMIFSIYIIFNKIVYKNIKFYPFILIGLILFSGMSRYSNLKHKFYPKNESWKIIKNNLEKIDFPTDSQIVFLGIQNVTLGWNRNSGYLKYVLKKKDVSGIIGPSYHANYNFIDHFNPNQRGWISGYTGMVGLSIDKPTFFFLKTKSRGIKQFEYILQWNGKTNNASWIILYADKKTGILSPFLSGDGMGCYLITLNDLSKQGISRKEILWGGPPSPKEQKRLNNLRLDPVILKSGLYNRFRKIETDQAEQVLQVSETIIPPVQNIKFGYYDEFLLITSIPEEIEDENGEINILIHCLLRVLKPQKTDLVKLGMLLRDEIIKKNLMLKHFIIENREIELERGNYILGSFEIPYKNIIQAKSQKIDNCSLFIYYLDSKQREKNKSLNIDRNEVIVSMPIDKILSTINLNYSRVELGSDTRRRQVKLW